MRVEGSTAGLTGKAVEGSEDTESTPAGRGRGGMKTVAGAASDAEAGECEASAAAKAAAVLCCVRVEASVRCRRRRIRTLAEEDPDVESAALCGEGRSVLRMLCAIDSDHLSENNVQKSIM
jgi:hypothetical protein